MPDNVKNNLLLFCDSQFDENKNKVILEATISYIKNSGKFSGSLLNNDLLLNDFYLKP